MALAGWFEGRVPDAEDLEAAGDMTMGDLLIHLFGTDALGRTRPQETPQEGQEAFYSVQGTLGADGPSRAALEALSAHGVTGVVHLRTLEDDVTYSLDGSGAVDESEERFLP